MGPGGGGSGLLAIANKLRDRLTPTWALNVIGWRRAPGSTLCGWPTAVQWLADVLDYMYANNSYLHK